MTDRTIAHFRSVLDRRIAWLRNDALPLWATQGVDPRGGFYERLDHDGRPVHGLPRRARVVARQTYVFTLAAARGWGDYAALADHGASAIFDRCLLDTGLSLSTYDEDGTPRQRDFDGYDQAFVLFALATLAGQRADLRQQASTAGERLLTEMHRHYRHPEAGFEEFVPRRLPLLQNPHMHLLEACLAFDRVPGVAAMWREQARALVSLADTRLADCETGAIHEYFDGNWQPVIDDAGGWLEPGHQFEWAWLLWQWHDRHGDEQADTMAHRLYGIATTHGLSETGQAIDAIDARLVPRARALRLWPQTERLKAAIALAGRTKGEIRHAALLHATQALACLDPYLDTPTAGLWHDRLAADGQVAGVAPAPASSLYHIVCALDYADQYARIHLSQVSDE